MHLGELERKVMEHVWTEYPHRSFVVRDVVNHFSAAREPYAYNTILTVITHLYEKKLLKRKAHGKNFTYTVSVNRHSFVAKASRALFKQMEKEYGPLAIAHFANILDEIDPQLLKRARQELNRNV